MNRILIASMAALFALPALADGPTRAKSKTTTASRPEYGKLEAPVVVSAKVDGASAQVQIGFEAAASDVVVRIWGVDGLAVSSVQPVIEPISQIAPDQMLSYEVGFAPGPGRSLLAVSVTGKFNNGRRSTVRSFAIGTPTADQQKSSGRIVTDSQGRRIKLMPVKPQ